MLDSYILKINKNQLTEEDVFSLIKELCFDKSELKDKIKDKIKGNEFIRKVISQKFNCEENEVYVGDIEDDNFYNMISNGTFSYKVIVGDVNLHYFDKLKDMGETRVILGNLLFNNIWIKDVSSLEMVLGNVFLKESKIVDISNLKDIGGNMNISSSYIKDVCGLEKIHGSLICKDSNIKSFDSLKEISKNAVISGNVKNINALEKIGGNANFRGLKAKSMNSLKEVKGHIIFEMSEIEKIPSLKFANFCLFNDKIKKVPQLERFGGYIGGNKELQAYIKVNFSESVGSENRFIRRFIPKK